MAFLGEAKELNLTFYIGVGLITLSVVLQMYSSVRERRTQMKYESQSVS